MVYSHYMIVSMYANISKANKKLILYKKGGKRKGETGTESDAEVVDEYEGVGGGRTDEAWSDTDVRGGWEWDGEGSSECEGDGGGSSRDSVGAMSEMDECEIHVYEERVRAEWGEKVEESRVWKEWGSKGEGGWFDREDVRRGDEWMRRWEESMRREVEEEERRAGVERERRRREREYEERRWEGRERAEIEGEGRIV